MTSAENCFFLEHICTTMISVVSCFFLFRFQRREISKIPTHTRATKYLQPEVSPPCGCMAARTECTEHARTTRTCSEHATHRTWPQCNRGLPAMTNEQRLASSPRPVAFLHRGAGNEAMLLSLSCKATGPCILSCSLCCSPTIFKEILLRWVPWTESDLHISGASTVFFS